MRRPYLQTDMRSVITILTTYFSFIGSGSVTNHITTALWITGFSFLYINILLTICFRFQRHPTRN